MEEIKPAIPGPSTLKDLSPQEFQEMLNVWFEEKGVKADLKCHLKYKMINILKNTVIGKTITKSGPKTNTLAHQALHLIIAEYLLQNQCHYSLSLFSSEVNLTKVLPEINLFMQADQVSQTKRLDEQNLVNILELIGLSKDSEYGQHIVKMYFDKKSQKTILACLLDNIKGERSKNFSGIDVGLDDFMQKISQILQSTLLSKQTYMRVLSEIKLCHELRDQAYKNQCLKLINKCKNELNLRDRKIRNCNKHRKKLENELLQSQKEREKLKQQLEDLLEEEKPKHVIDKQIVPSLCSLDHCSAKCVRLNESINYYQKENNRLKNENKNYKEEIQNLILNYNQLKQELRSYQSKISILNNGLQNKDEDLNLRLPNVHLTNKRSDGETESSSESLTEEILQETRRKLRELEQESDQIDINYRSFLNIIK